MGATVKSKVKSSPGDRQDFGIFLPILETGDQSTFYHEMDVRILTLPSKATMGEIPGESTPQNHIEIVAIRSHPLCHPCAMGSDSHGPSHTFGGSVRRFKSQIGGPEEFDLAEVDRTVNASWNSGQGSLPFFCAIVHFFDAPQKTGISRWRHHNC